MPISEDQKRTVKIAAVWLSAIALGMVHLWRIQDIPWISDEPKLIIKAIVANSTGTWAKTGLVGSFGIAYSPIVVWFYQILLRCTLNIVTVALVKTALSLALLYGAAAVLQRETKLSLVGIWLIVASPYIWFYNRIVWDNVFLIPLSLWLLAMMASFFKTPRAWKVYVSGLICVLLMHVHLMAIIPISAALATTALARWKNLRHEWKWFSATIVGAILLFLPYLLSLRTQVIQKTQEHDDELVASLTASLTGFRFFSHWKFDYLAEGAYAMPILRGGMGFTLSVALVLFVTGSVLAARKWMAIFRRRQVAEHLDWLSVYALFTIAGMTAFFVVTRAIPLPHYFNASWGAYLFLCWYGLSCILARYRWSVAIYGVHVLTLVLLTVSIMIGVRKTNGHKSFTYGPTLRNQLELAKTLAPYWPIATLNDRYSCYRHFPHALNCLIRLEVQKQHLSPYRGPQKRFIIQFTTPPNQPDGTMELIELPPLPERSAKGVP